MKKLALALVLGFSFAFAQASNPNSDRDILRVASESSGCCFRNLEQNFEDGQVAIEYLGQDDEGNHKYLVSLEGGGAITVLIEDID